MVYHWSLARISNRQFATVDKDMLDNPSQRLSVSLALSQGDRFLHWNPATLAKSEGKLKLEGTILGESHC